MSQIQTNFTGDELQSSCHSLHNNTYLDEKDTLFWISVLEKYNIKFYMVSPAELRLTCSCNSTISVHLQASNNIRWWCNSCKCHLDPRFQDDVIGLILYFNQDTDLTRTKLIASLQYRKTKKTKPVKSKPVPKNNNIFSIFEEPK